ncbi:MAG: proprotein convertase P-domain-containing protein [Pseudomonadota bacterium]|nr:proprotein convertase P-domain-containing protein [Pseudomonadota bacterium]
MKAKTRFNGRVLAFALSATLSMAALAQNSEVVTPQINQARGVDATVDYPKLTQYGPWDDRNYKLTARDLTWLAKNEAELDVPIPAFFRVQLRKSIGVDFPHYPMSAVPGFLQMHGGYEIDGVRYQAIERVGNNSYRIYDERKEARGADFDARFASGERRVSSPIGGAESAVAINPVNHSLLIASTNGPGGGQKMWRSSDSGTTWISAGALPDVCCDPTVAWSPDGTIGYVSTLSFSNAAGSIRFYRSTDNGATWTKTANLSTTSGADKEFIHVDVHAASPFLGNVYESWHEANVQKFSRSTNNGLTFSTKITLDSSNRGIGSDITTDTSGNVYFFYATFDTSTFAKQVRVVKSTNGGVSFAAGLAVANNNGSFNFAIPAFETRKVPIIVSADADRSGGAFNNSIYSTWTDNNNATSATAANNHARIKVARSRDGGATWAISTPHSTADIGSVDRFNPWLSVDPSGRVHVIYYDTRNSVGRSGTDIYHAVSADGGVTWGAPTRRTSVTSSNLSDSFEWGDYNGLDVAGVDIMAIYTDNRDESGGSAQSKDVYSVGFATSGGNIPPTANFTSVASGLTVNFTDTSSDSDGTIAARSWNFGDSTTSTATNPSKTYAAAGTYSVTLTATDNGGASSSTTKSVTVSSGGAFFQNTTDFAINDNSTIESPVTVTGVAGNAPSNLQVAVRILHTYKGDLRVDLVAPDGTLYNLHNGTGGSADNIIQTFTVNASSEVANGIWKLRVADQATVDTGTLDQWSMQF